jgi:hypothetical protein
MRYVIISDGTVVGVLGFTEAQISGAFDVVPLAPSEDVPPVGSSASESGGVWTFTPADGSTAAWTLRYG